MINNKLESETKASNEIFLDETSNITIAMPNEIFSELKEWSDLGELKSIQHQEFTYAYYWLLAYLWRFSSYAKRKIGQAEIKSLLGYNSTDKRLNYIMKKKGLMNKSGYCLATKSYPVASSVDANGSIFFNMLHDLDEEDRKHLSHNDSNNFFVQSPLKHIGDSKVKGVFWDNSDTHLINISVFKVCMSDSKLSCAGFYLYGLLNHINDSIDDYPIISNDLLCGMTGWHLSRVTRVKSRLVEIGLIDGLLSAAASRGERRIYDFLSKHDLRTIPEYPFDDLNGLGERSLRFDFAIFDEHRNIKLLIEYDGEHHYQPVDYTGLSKEWGEVYLKQTNAHDEMKNGYCFRNNIPLLRIPYWEFDNIEKILTTILETLNLLERSFSFSKEAIP